MKEKFKEHFEVVDRNVMNAAWGKNVCITSMDFAKQNSVLDTLKEVRWDLIIVDEAHKMAAYKYGDEVKKTQRYRLGEVLSKTTSYFLLDEKEKLRHEQPKTQACSICGYENAPEADFCLRCRKPLNLKAALEAERRKGNFYD